MSDLGILGADLGVGPSLASAANGWASGARALVAGPANAQMAYQRGQLAGAQTASALELARERRDKNLALQSITAQALADPSQRAAVQAAMIRAERNPAQLANAQKTNQLADEQLTLFNAAQNGAGLDKLNPSLAVYHGEPVKLSEVQGNTLLDPYALPSGQADVGGNVPTAVGQADIAAAAARANASNAAAGASNASRQRQLAGINADKASNYDIVQDDQGNTYRINKLDPTATSPVLVDGQPFKMGSKGGGAAGGLKPAPLNPTTATQLFGAPGIKGNASPAFQDFEAWRAQMAQNDPRYLNGDWAAAQYQLRAQNTKTAISDAVNASMTPVSLANAAAKGGQGDAPTTGVAAQVQNAVAAPPVIKQSDLSSLPAPKSQAEYDALPAGATYLYTDGTVQVKGG